MHNIFSPIQRSSGRYFRFCLSSRQISSKHFYFPPFTKAFSQNLPIFHFFIHARFRTKQRSDREKLINSSILFDFLCNSCRRGRRRRWSDFKLFSRSEFAAFHQIVNEKRTLIFPVRSSRTWKSLFFFHFIKVSGRAESAARLLIQKKTSNSHLKAIQQHQKHSRRASGSYLLRKNFIGPHGDDFSLNSPLERLTLLHQQIGF